MMMTTDVDNVDCETKVENEKKKMMMVAVESNIGNHRCGGDNNDDDNNDDSLDRWRHEFCSMVDSDETDGTKSSRADAGARGSNGKQTSPGEDSGKEKDQPSNIDSGTNSVESIDDADKEQDRQNLRFLEKAQRLISDEFECHHRRGGTATTTTTTSSDHIIEKWVTRIYRPVFHVLPPQGPRGRSIDNEEIDTTTGSTNNNDYILKQIVWYVQLFLHIWISSNKNKSNTTMSTTTTTTMGTTEQIIARTIIHIQNDEQIGKQDKKDRSKKKPKKGKKQKKKKTVVESSPERSKQLLLDHLEDLLSRAAFLLPSTVPFGDFLTQQCLCLQQHCWDKLPSVISYLFDAFEVTDPFQPSNEDDEEDDLIGTSANNKLSNNNDDNDDINGNNSKTRKSRNTRKRREEGKRRQGSRRKRLKHLLNTSSIKNRFGSSSNNKASRFNSSHNLHTITKLLDNNNNNGTRQPQLNPLTNPKQPAAKSQKKKNNDRLPSSSSLSAPNTNTVLHGHRAKQSSNHPRKEKKNQSARFTDSTIFATRGGMDLDDNGHFERRKRNISAAAPLSSSSSCFSPRPVVAQTPVKKNNKRQHAQLQSDSMAVLESPYDSNNLTFTPNKTPKKEVSWKTPSKQTTTTTATTATATATSQSANETPSKLNDAHNLLLSPMPMNNGSRGRGSGGSNGCGGGSSRFDRVPHNIGTIRQQTANMKTKKNTTYTKQTKYQHTNRKTSLSSSSKRSSSSSSSSTTNVGLLSPLHHSSNRNTVEAWKYIQRKSS